MIGTEPAVMLSVPEVAHRLCVKADLVRAWIGRGELVGVNVADRARGRPRWRIAREELERFIRARQSVPAPKIGRRSHQEDEQVFFSHGRPVMTAGSCGQGGHQ